MQWCKEYTQVHMVKFSDEIVKWCDKNTYTLEWKNVDNNMILCWREYTQGHMMK